MKRCVLLAIGILAVSSLLATAEDQKPAGEQKPAEQKAADKNEKKADQKPATRTLAVKLNYTGAGTVDNNHKIIVFLFDSPDFSQGTAMPIAMTDATAKDQKLEFTDVSASPVYIVAAFDPTGNYDVQGPPPSGSSLGVMVKDGAPAAIALEPGKPAEIELRFDDTIKMP